MTADDLRAWRTRLGLSQSKAAEALNNTSRRTYQEWEAGNVKPPTCLSLACQMVASRTPYQQGGNDRYYGRPYGNSYDSASDRADYDDGYYNEIDYKDWW